MTPPKHCNKYMEEIENDGVILSAPTYDTEPEQRITEIKYECVVCGRKEWHELDNPIYR
jgi:hypothetical protein